MLSIRKNQTLHFKDKKGVWKGNIKEWKGETAILILHDLKDESIKYYVPDNLIKSVCVNCGKAITKDNHQKHLNFITDDFCPD